MDYHDREWGVPVWDDQILFEFLLLEGVQAGLSWITVLKKRAHYRKVLDNFDATKIANYGESKRNMLLKDPGIIRNRLKVESAISNARAYLELQAKGGFANFVWGFVDGRPLQHHYKQPADIPAETEVSKAMSKSLKKHGFNFVGPTICYAFMQATGLVNDHVVDCFRHEACRLLGLDR